MFPGGRVSEHQPYSQPLSVKVRKKFGEEEKEVEEARELCGRLRSG